jgi:iron complex transport system ATP-binding protein
MAAPKLLILDEPCAGLDPAAREEFLTFLTRQAALTHSVPLLFVTHHVEEIIPSLTHVLVLKTGRILTAGPLSQLKSKLLSEAFSCQVTLHRKNNRFTLSVQAKNGFGSKIPPRLRKSKANR